MQRSFKRSSFDLCYHSAAHRGTGISLGYFSSSVKYPLLPGGHGDPTGDCPDGEREYHPPGGVVVGLSGDHPHPQHHGVQLHLGGGVVNGVIWGCREVRQLRNCSQQLPKRCSRYALPEQSLRIGCRRCSRNEPDFGCPLLLQTGGGTGQGRSRRTRSWGGRTRCLGTRTRTKSLGRLQGRTRPSLMRMSRLVGEYSRDPPCQDLLHDPPWRWK